MSPWFNHARYDAMGQLAQEYRDVVVGTEVAGRSYLFTDHLGSTRLQVAQDGAVQGWWDYAPFGEMVRGELGGRNAVNGFPYGGSATSVMFTGKERDSETGLDYFGARYFSGALGRFTSPDAPLIDQDPTDPQSWNLYSYVRNNPLIFTDPTGRCKKGDDGKYHDSDEGPCVAAGETSVTVTEKAPKERDHAAEVQAEMTRMQYEAWRRNQERSRPKEDQPLNPSAQKAAQNIHDTFAVLPNVCSMTVSANGGGAGGRMRFGAEYNTEQGFAWRGRAQGGIGPMRGRMTMTSGGKVSTSVRVGGTYGVTMGFSGSSISSIGLSANLSKFLSVGISGQIGTSYSCVPGGGSSAGAE